jgi:hypothetical protein
MLDHIQDSRLRRISKIRSPLSQTDIRKIDTQKDSKMGTKNIHDTLTIGKPTYHTPLCV